MITKTKICDIIYEIKYNNGGRIIQDRTEAFAPDTVIAFDLHSSMMP